MFLLLLILFTCVPAIELFLLFQVGGQIGALNTIFIIIATGVVGAAMAKSQGLELLYKIQEEINQGQIPTGKLFQGFLVMGGGLLLLTPGFVTDILGFAMVMPGSRNLLAALIRKAFAKQIQSGNIHVFTSMGAGSSNPGQSRREDFEASPFSKQEESLQGGVFEAEYTKKDGEL